MSPNIGVSPALARLLPPCECSDFSEVLVSRARADHQADHPVRSTSDHLLSL